MDDTSGRICRANWKGWTILQEGYAELIGQGWMILQKGYANLIGQGGTILQEGYAALIFTGMDDASRRIFEELTL